MAAFSHIRLTWLESFLVEVPPAREDQEKETACHAVLPTLVEHGSGLELAVRLFVGVTVVIRVVR